jgi:hypothetical protein
MTLTNNEELASLPSPPTKKDKKAVIDEVITDEVLERFFSLQAPAGVNTDYHILERAYRGLVAADFSRFVELFVAKSGDLNARGPQGTILQLVSRHAKSGEYAQALKNAGAH